jgi:hypothetical protein
MPEGKTIVAEETIPITKEDSASSEYDENVLVNKASEMGHTLKHDGDVAPGNLDWSEMEPLQEFDRIAEERGVGSQSQPAVEQPPTPASPEPYTEALTDNMSKRITDLKRKAQQNIEGKDQEIAERDAIIAARDDQINKLSGMAQDFQKLQATYVPPTGDASQVDTQISTMDQMLEDDGDTYTAAEVARHVMKRQELVRQKDQISQAQLNAQSIVKQQEVMRLNSDQYVRDNYSFVSNPDSEYYKTLKTQAYPMLESIIGPNFKNHPQDMVLAAELSRLMVDAAKYQQITGNAPAPRQEPIPMAGHTAPQTQSQQQRQPSFRSDVTDLRGGDVKDFAKLLAGRGHTWRP